MSDTRINISDAPMYLRTLLLQLPSSTGGFQVSQHFHDPHPDEWYVGWNTGELGPYKSAEEALAAGIKRLYTLLEEARNDRDIAEANLATVLKEKLGGDDVPPAWSRAFDK